jgi:hypothetical protein
MELKLKNFFFNSNLYENINLNNYNPGFNQFWYVTVSIFKVLLLCLLCIGITKIVYSELRSFLADLIKNFEAQIAMWMWSYFQWVCGAGELLV